MTSLFGEPEHRDWGLWFYDGVLTWPNGMRVHYHTREDRYYLTESRFALECPGESVAAMAPLDLLKFLDIWSASFEISVTRLDERWIDYEWIITPYQLAKTVHEVDPDTGRVTRRHHSKLESFHEEFPDDGKKLKQAEVDFGNRGSAGGGSYLRVYDKNLESDGKIPAVCWELESSGEAARKRFRDILTTAMWAASEHKDPVAEVCSVIGQHIGGCIDFLDYDQGDKNLNRCPRYPFWVRILERLGGRITWFAERVVKTVEKARGFVERQVMPSLQLLRAALGPERFWDWFINEQMDGEDRLRAAHHKAIADYRITCAVEGVTDLDIKQGLAAFVAANAPVAMVPV